MPSNDALTALATALHPEVFGNDIDTRTAYVQQMWRSGQRRAREQAEPVLAALQASGYSLVTADRLAALEAIEAAARALLDSLREPAYSENRYPDYSEKAATALRSLLDTGKAGEG